MNPLPVIIEPFSTFGDEIVGDSVDELARNLAAATRTSLAWRCKLRRACPDVWTVFQGHYLSPQAKLHLREVAEVYARATARKADAAGPGVIAQTQPQLSLL